MAIALDPLPERELCPYEKLREDIIKIFYIIYKSKCFSVQLEILILWDYITFKNLLTDLTDRFD